MESGEGKYAGGGAGTGMGMSVRSLSRCLFIDFFFVFIQSRTYFGVSPKKWTCDTRGLFKMA